MRTTESKAAAAARIGAALGPRKRAEQLEGLRPCFTRTEPWLQAGKYAAAVMSDLRRRNGWRIAERSGDPTPDRTQRLLNRAVWDTFAAMGVVRRFAVAGQDEAARKTGRPRGLAVGAIDETGQVKAGARTAGVKRQYLGCVGKVANGINTVHLSYVREVTGHALIGAREWIPAAHIDDPVTSRVMGLPDGLAFRTKGQLAIDILTEAFADGVRLDFVCGDEVYGSCTELREFCEDRDQAYVLRVPCSFRLTVASGFTLTCKQAAARLGRRRGWEVRSAGSGSKGQRWYAWAWLATASARHHLLIRRHLATANLPFATATCPRVSRHPRPGRSAPPGCAGRPKKISSSARTASGSTSPRSGCMSRSPGTPCWSWPPWPSAPSPPPCSAPHRHPATRPRTPGPTPAHPDQPPPADPGMIPLTVPETGRLLAHPPPPGSAAHCWPGGAATRPDPAGTTSAHASPAIPQLSWSASQWRLPH